MKVLARVIPILLIALITGCEVRFVQWGEIPTDPVKLVEYSRQLEVDIQQKESELSVAKESRDVIAKAAENANGWFDRDSSMTKLARANKKVESANWWLGQYKARLSQVQEKIRSQPASRE